MKTNKVQQVGSVANQIVSNIDNPQDYRVYSPGGCHQLYVLHRVAVKRHMW